MAEPLLQVTDLGKRFDSRSGTVTAIEGLSFSVDDGELVGVVGPSGGGKTTMVRVIAGLLRPTTGTVLLAGRRVESPPPDLIVLFQQYEKTLLPWRTVEGNVRFGLENQPLDRQERKHRVAEALDAVGLAEAARQYPHQLSGGMQQRAAIARALARRPRILLMDEPFSSLDALTRADLQDLLLRLWQEHGQTILLVTHDVDEAVYLATRVLVLSARPARVRDDVSVQLPYPRNQIQTREDTRYLEVRHHVYELIQSRMTSDARQDTALSV